MSSVPASREPAKDAPVIVETDLFEHSEVQPHFINDCCFGEDFAHWLKTRLGADAHLALALSDPIQEDWGWGLWASAGKDRYWIALSYMGEGPQEEPGQWSVAVEPAFSLRRLFGKAPALVVLRFRIRQLLEAEPRIRILE